MTIHGENAHRRAARQAGESGQKQVNAEFEKNKAETANSVEIAINCFCNWRPYPHLATHTLFERVKQIKIWNQQSKHKLRLPTEFKEQHSSYRNSAARAAKG